MIGLLYFFLSVLAGIILLQALPMIFTVSEWVCAGSIVGITLASWLTFLLVALLGYQYGLALTIVLLAGVVIWGIPRFWHPKSFQPEPKVTLGWQYFFVWASVVGLVILFLYLLFTHFIRIESTGWYSAGYTWGDLALHMSLASRFAHASTFNLDFSLVHGLPLSYPFLTDFYTGMMVRLGSSWQAAFLLPTVVLLLGFARLLIGFTYRVLKNLRAVWIHLVIVLFSGSVWGMVDYARDALQQGWKVATAQDYSNLATDNLHFANFITSHLLPQRTYLGGIAAFFVIALLLYHWEQSRQAALVVMAGILIGLLPFIHVQAFFIAIGGLGLLGIWVWFVEHRPPQGWWIALLLALLLALPQMLWQFATAYHAHFTSVEIGWMTPKGTSIIIFWLRNVGLALPLALGIPWMLNRVSGRFIRVLLILGAVIFLVGNIWIFQPNDWDNMKFFTYAYLFLMIPVAGWLATWTYTWYTAIPVGLVIASLTGSGILALYREQTLNYELLSNGDLALGQYIENHTNPDAVILTSNLDNHPVTLLAGRPIVMGYEGWLWSYGINYTTREQDVNKMFAGGPQAAQLLAKYQVQYVVVNNNDRATMSVSDQFFITHYHFVTIVGGWTIYQIF